ncbi:hypothetical protein LUZ60_006553 [Juncus effusus]|nr:hypothetical protein LUZ60_006553 [Juncus effusus]
MQGSYCPHLTQSISMSVMSKLFCSSLLSLRIRCYSHATESAGMSVITPIVKDKAVKNIESFATQMATQKDMYWMRDPKTGYWIPENRFDEVDVVELRNQYLSK